MLKWSEWKMIDEAKEEWVIVTTKIFLFECGSDGLVIGRGVVKLGACEFDV